MCQSFEEQKEQLACLNTMVDELLKTMKEIATLWQSLPSERQLEDLTGSANVLAEALSDA